MYILTLETLADGNLGIKRGVAVCVYILTLETLADGILGIKHGVAAFAIQFLECYYNAAACCNLVDRVYI